MNNSSDVRPLLGQLQEEASMSGLTASLDTAYAVIMLLEVAVLECRRNQEFVIPQSFMASIHPFIERLVESDVEKPLPGSFHEAVNVEMLQPGERSIVHSCAGFRGQPCTITIVPSV